MNTGTEDRDKRPGAEAGAKSGELGANALLQQQLQLLQLQQQQLASMSPSEIAAMTQQMALFMMPMMPFMMPLNQQLVAGSAEATTTAAASASTTTVATTTGSTAASTADTSTSPAPAAFTAPDAVGDAFSSQSSPLSLLGGAPFGNLTPSAEEAPKRKRGRPPKKDVAARAKADAEKTIKQFPMWGYGLPMPLLPGFPGVLPGGAAAVKDESQAASEDQKEGGMDAAALDASAAEVGKPPKKKSRGTGKPRGRPRTRPRPGEIIHRVKPPAIAPANYSVMYNYSLSNMAAKSSELGGDDSGASADASAATSAHDDTRLASLGASLLSADHE